MGAYEAGSALHGVLAGIGGLLNNRYSALPTPASARQLGDILGGIGDFGSGVINGAQPQPIVTMKLPVARPVAAPAPAQPMRVVGAGDAAQAYQRGAQRAAAKAAGVDNGGNPVNEMFARYAAANGGISLHEMALLSRSAAETSPLRTQPKAPTYKDVVANQMLQGAMDQFNLSMGAAQQAKAGGDVKAASKLQADAVREKNAMLAQIMGANPVDIRTAANMTGEPE